MIKCNINSIESMGLKDGPGIRTVIFLQGCNLRCNYCHNPEMWSNEVINEYSVIELMDIIKRYKPYYKDNGGITVSGGEPLLQINFITELFKECKKEGISTCLDTAGVGLGDYGELLQYTDIVLLDIKHTKSVEYTNLVHHDIADSLNFIDALNKSNCKIWIRQVIIPNFNDNLEYIHSLKEFLTNIPNIEKIDLLPYHSMAKEKYENLGINYVLKDTLDMNITKCDELYKELIKNT